VNKPNSFPQFPHHSNAARRRFSAATCLLSSALALLAGCTDDAPSPAPQSPITPPAGCTSAVAPSGGDDLEAVQTLLIEAKEGDTVCLLEGSYSFSGELSIATPSLTFKGAGQGKTILDFSGQMSGANGIQITSDNVTVTEFGAGARDAGIYVGQSTHILVADSEVWGNVAGIELENSTDAEVRGCHAHDNTGGILVFNLPNLPMQGGKRAKVHNNIIERNNLDNFAAAGTIVARVPTGTGIMLLAADENEFHDNTIKDNNSIGVVIFSYNPPIFDDPNDPAFDKYPQSNWIHDNTLENNGTMPSQDVLIFIPLSPVPDVVWDGCADAKLDNTSGAFTNCLSNNGAATFHSMGCGESGASSGDISKVTCEHMPLSTQDP
jgi:hypothetical protein